MKNKSVTKELVTVTKSYLKWAAVGMGIVLAVGALNHAFNKESVPEQKVPAKIETLQNVPR